MNSLVHNYCRVHKENVAIKDSAYAKPSFISNKKPQSHPSNKKRAPNTGIMTQQHRDAPTSGRWKKKKK